MVACAGKLAEFFVVESYVVSITRRLHVEFDTISAEFDGAGKGRKRVFWILGRRLRGARRLEESYDGFFLDWPENQRLGSAM